MTTPKIAVRPTDPLVIIAGIRQFGLASDGSDLRDLETALRRSQCDVQISDAAGIEWFERTFGVPLGDKPGAADVERVRASAVSSAEPLPADRYAVDDPWCRPSVTSTHSQCEGRDNG